MARADLLLACPYSPSNHCIDSRKVRAPSLLQRSEQKRTSSHARSHFLRQVNGRPQCRQIFSGSGRLLGMTCIRYCAGAASTQVTQGRSGRPRVDHRKPKNRTDFVPNYLGIRTVSMTWMTPLSATMSVLTTLAPSTLTLPSATVTVMGLP